MHVRSRMPRTQTAYAQQQTVRHMEEGIFIFAPVMRLQSQCEEGCRLLEEEEPRWRVDRKCMLGWLECCPAYVTKWSSLAGFELILCTVPVCTSCIYLCLGGAASQARMAKNGDTCLAQHSLIKVLYISPIISAGGISVCEESMAVA